jgi:hypothetical protein
VRSQSAREASTKGRSPRRRSLHAVHGIALAFLTAGCRAGPGAGLCRVGSQLRRTGRGAARASQEGPRDGGQARRTAHLPTGKVEVKREACQVRDSQQGGGGRDKGRGTQLGNSRQRPRHTRGLAEAAYSALLTAAGVSKSHRRCGEAGRLGALVQSTRQAVRTRACRGGGRRQRLSGQGHPQLRPDPLGGRLKVCMGGKRGTAAEDGALQSGGKQRDGTRVKAALARRLGDIGPVAA